MTEQEGDVGRLTLSARLREAGGTRKRSMSTGQLRALAKTEVEALEARTGEGKVRPPAADESGGPCPSELGDEEYAAQLLEAGDGTGQAAADEEGPKVAAVTAERPAEPSATGVAGTSQGQAAGQDSVKRERVAELFRVLVAGQGGQRDMLAESADHRYFIEWLQTARIFCRLELEQRNRLDSESADDIYADLLGSGDFNYAAVALQYYQQCLSLLPNLPGLTVEEHKQARRYLLAELGCYYEGRSDYKKTLQIATALLSEDREAQQMQMMLRNSVGVLVAHNSPEIAAFVVNTISKLKEPVASLDAFITTTFLTLQKFVAGNDEKFVQARVHIIDWYRRVLAQTRVKRQRNRLPLSTSLRLSGGIAPDEGEQSAHQSEESQFLLDLLVDFRERDSSELVREAAKKAIELVGDFTLQIVEEGYEEAEGEDAEGHVITIQVYMDSLVLRSEYFKTMLSTNMREQQTKRIRVVTSQPYAFLAMIDFFYYEEIKFESTDHALEVLLLANQYGVDKLRNAATQFLNNNSTRYVNEISHDWEKLEEVYYLADTLDLKALKNSLASHLTRSNPFFARNDELPQGSERIQYLQEMYARFPSLFAQLPLQLLLVKLQAAASRDEWELCEFIVEVLLKRDLTDYPTLNFKTILQPPLPDSDTCAECQVRMGHLTHCSQFKKFRDIAMRPRVPIPPPPPQPQNTPPHVGDAVLLIILKQNQDSPQVRQIAQRLLRSKLCHINAKVIHLLLLTNHLEMVEEAINVLIENCLPSKLEEQPDGKGKGKIKDLGTSSTGPRFVATVHHRWQWEDNGGNWQDYDSITNEKMEEVFTSGSSTVLNHGHRRIDFLRQKEMDTTTNVEWNIRRKGDHTVNLLKQPLNAIAEVMNERIKGDKTLLYYFIRNQIPLELLERMLILGEGAVDVNIRFTDSKTQDEVTLLAYVIEMIPLWHDARAIAYLLLSVGANPNDVFTETTPLGKKKSTPLLLAIKQNDIELLQKLIEAGSDVKINTPAVQHALSSIPTDQPAISYDPKTDIFESLNSPSDRNPLSVACGAPASKENVEIVKLLLEHGALSQMPTQDVGAKAMLPPPPLFLPSSSVSPSPMSVFDTTVRGNTPLMIAAFFGREDLVELLLAAGQQRKPDTKGKGKEIDEHIDKGEILAGNKALPVSYLCDVRTKNWWKWTALHFATYAGHEEVVRLLAQVPGVQDSEAVITSRGIVNSARQMAAGKQFNRILTILCSLSMETNDSPATLPEEIHHSAGLPLSTFTSVSSMGSDATSTAVTRLTPKPKKKLWDRLKFL